MERGSTLWLGLHNKQREAEGCTHEYTHNTSTSTHTQPFPFLQGAAEAVWSQQSLHGSMTYFKTILPLLVMVKNPSLPLCRVISHMLFPCLTVSLHVPISSCNFPFQFSSLLHFAFFPPSSAFCPSSLFSARHDSEPC